jgi:hypothetical protein
MKVAFGLKSHSGWAALVVLGNHAGELQVVDRAATIASLGKSVGPPWGQDQKDASLAAMIALHGQRA